MATREGSGGRGGPGETTGLVGNWDDVPVGEEIKTRRANPSPLQGMLRDAAKVPDSWKQRLFDSEDDADAARKELRRAANQLEFSLKLRGAITEDGKHVVQFRIPGPLKREPASADGSKIAATTPAKASSK